MSLVQRALDKLAPEAAAPEDGARPELENLPRDEWWKLFIEGDKHDFAKTDDENAMRFDSDQSPGYYAAMSRAFETYVANSDGHELSFADYDAMHQAVTRDTLSKGDNNTFRPVPHKLSARDIQFPMTHGEFPNPKALEELRAEGMLGLNEAGMSTIGIFPDDPDRDARVRNANQVVAEGHEEGRFSSTVDRAPVVWLSLREIYQGQGPLTDFSSSLRVVRVATDNSTQLLVTTNREESAAAGEVSTLFRDYYTEIRTVAGGDAERGGQAPGDAGRHRPAGPGAARRPLLPRRERPVEHHGAAEPAVAGLRILTGADEPHRHLRRRVLREGAGGRDRGRLPGLPRPGAAGPSRPRRPGGAARA